MKIICKNYHKYIRMYLDQRNEKKFGYYLKLEQKVKIEKKNRRLNV